MKYMYSDSVGLPVHRDFIRDLQNLLKATVDAYPLEQEIITTNKKMADELRVKDQKSAILETFESDVRTHLDRRVTDDAIEEVNICKNTTTVACASCADQQKATIESDFDVVISDLTDKVDYNSGQIRTILGGFLEFGVYDAKQRYSLVSERAAALHGEFDFDD